MPWSPHFLRRLTQFALCALSLSGCAGTLQHERRAMNAEVVLLSFGSVLGQFHTEGGHAGNVGGLARRAALVRSLRAQSGEVLHLDLGDFTATPEAVDRGDWVSTEAVWDGVIAMGLDATIPGANELTDWRAYQSRIEASGVPIVCSNLLVREGARAKPVGRASLVVRVNGVRVALFGLVGEGAMGEAHPPRDLEFQRRPAVEVARALVPELRERADLVVLMSQLDDDEIEGLLDAVPGIDVVLCGRKVPWVQELTLEHATIVQRTGTRGQYAGCLHLVVDPVGQVVYAVADNHRLGSDAPSDAVIEQQVDSLVAEFRAARESQFAIDRERRLNPAFQWRVASPDAPYPPSPPARPKRVRVEPR
ncbi:MAG: hypothetical protein U0527_16785 [Candidatus Eisenbacteria bacterium]